MSNMSKTVAKLLQPVSRWFQDRKALREHRIRNGLCARCGDGPPYDGELLCPMCAETKCL